MPIPQERLRGIERGGGIATVGIHTCAVDTGQAQDVGHHQFGKAGQVRVFHEEPTDQVMLVAKPGRHAVIGQQHHPGILQTTGRQHVHPRADPVPEPTQRLQLQMLDMPTLADCGDVHHVCIEQHVDIPRRRQFAAIAFAEMGGRTEMHEPDLHPAGDRVGQRLTGDALPVGLVVESWRRDLHEIAGPFVIRQQRLPAERPAAVRDPVALLEVDRVQRPAKTAPMVGAAAEKAQPMGDHRVRNAGTLTVVQRLGRRLRLHAAGLDQAHPGRAVVEQACKADTGRTGTDDRDIGLKPAQVWQGTGIDEHGE